MSNNKKLYLEGSVFTRSEHTAFYDKMTDFLLDNVEENKEYTLEFWAYKNHFNGPIEMKTLPFVLSKVQYLLADVFNRPSHTHGQPIYSAILILREVTE